MNSTQRFYHKYFGLCCEWYLEQKKMEWAADSSMLQKKMEYHRRGR